METYLTASEVNDLHRILRALNGEAESGLTARVELSDANGEDVGVIRWSQNNAQYVFVTDPMLDIEADLPDQYKGAQQYLMDNFSEVPNELDPQLAWLVRNTAYQRALIIQQHETIEALKVVVRMLVEDVYATGGSDES